MTSTPADAAVHGKKPGHVPFAARTTIVGPTPTLAALTQVKRHRLCVLFLS